MDRSSRTDGFLNNTHHYDFEASKLRTYKDRNIDSEGFYGWTKDHMYRTSYVSAYTDKPVLQKSLAMPKYQGYIPYVVPENIHGKGYTPISKDCFSNNKLMKNSSGLATTGHNYKYEANLDQSMNATSSKYGKSALQRSHPAWSVDRMISTTHDTFKDPNKRDNPTFRQTEKFLQTNKKFTSTSGFGQNHDPFDGLGFKPLPVLDGRYGNNLGRRDISEYRNHYNNDKAFHRDSTLSKTRTLPKKSYNLRAD